MLVSIIMPVYNGERFIGEALDSILMQSYKNFELIVINDGSTDNTLEILQQYKTRFDERLLIINQPNQGQVVAKNKGLNLARGDFISFLDSDDRWHPRKLESQIDLLLKNPSVGLCYTEAVLIDERGNQIGYRTVNPSYIGKCFNKLIMGNCITASSVLLKRECIDKVGSFDTSLTACENWDLWLRISRISELKYIKKPLTYYRIHQEHMSKDLDKMRNARLQVLSKYKNVLPKDVYKAALFKVYSHFAGSYLWNLQLVKARQDAYRALKIKPWFWSGYLILLKSFLGKKNLLFLRKLKKKFC